ALKLAKADPFLFTVRSSSRKRAFAHMILTCPNCGTQYVVKDGAIPPEGRQVRCAACKHRWHQDPESAAAPEAQPEGSPAAEESVTDTAPQIEPEASAEDESLAEATMIDPRSGPEAEER